MFVSAFLFAAAQAVTPSAAQEYPGEDGPAVVIPRLEEEVSIDGRLDEPAWSRAARLTGFWQYEPVDARPAAERTEVLVWYAPDAIHFGIIAHDRQPGAIRATVADRDNIDGDDHVILYLDTFDDRRRAFFFAVNPLGIQQDGVRTEGASAPGRMFGGGTDKSPDYFFDSRGRVTDEGYVVEVRIPFKSLRLPGSGPQRWGFQVERKVQRTGYTDTWTDARRASASFLGQAGVIEGLHDLSRGVVLEAQPVVTASAAGARDDASGAFERGRLDQEFGVNLRVGFSNLSLDATVNPDFSQVEADAGQVTANERFALFLPEKRPFFLEGIELFATPSQLVYTRRIAAPSAGGKVTGKVGGIGIAHLTALDESGTEGDALFNITRLRRDFGAGSVAGVTYTDRTLVDGDDANRVLSADVRHLLGGMYFVEAQFGRSWTRDGEGDRSAPIWAVTLDRTGRRWGFNYALNGIGDDFATRSGFVPRTGIMDGHIFNRLSFYGEPGAALERVTFFLRQSRIWRYGDLGSRGAIEGGESLNSTFLLRGGWELEAVAARDFFDLDPTAYDGLVTGTPGGPVAYRGLDRVSGPSIELSVETPVFRRFDGSASASLGRTAIFAEGSEGTAAAVDVSLSLRPNESLRLSFSNAFQRITRRRDGSEFARTVIPRLRVEYQPTRALFFRAIGELRSERQAALADARTGAPLFRDGAPVAAVRDEGLRIDLLASYEPSPGTVVFLGYGSSLASESAFDLRGLERVSDGFYIKLAYQLRR